MIDFDFANDEEKPDENVPKMKKKAYEQELARMQLELVKMHEWIRKKKKKVVVIFEGRDAAGKGGTGQPLLENLNRYA